MDSFKRGCFHSSAVRVIGEEILLFAKMFNGIGKRRDCK